MNYFVFDFICNMFVYLFLIKYFAFHTHKHITLQMILSMIAISMSFSVFHTNLFIVILFFLCEFLFILFFFFDSFIKSFTTFIKYEFTKYMSFIVLYFVHSIILFDYNITINFNYYFEYKDIICNSLILIFYTMYTNTKKINILNRKHEYYFNSIIIISLLILSYVTLYICKNISPDNYVFPLLFTIIYILIAICVNLYDRFIVILNENIESKISSEKAKMEADYSENIDSKLKELHSIRHDIKNHLIIIDGYIKLHDIDNAHKYIQNIHDSFEDTYIVDTPCSSINNILNAKYQLCLNNGIKFNFYYNFSNITIDDYSLITILGNLLDNAITATAKLDANKRVIDISIKQIASYLEICIENQHKEHIRKLGNDFISTKEKDAKNEISSFHGIGLKNIRLTTNRLNGHLQIDYTDTAFSVSVILPNY